MTQEKERYQPSLADLDAAIEDRGSKGSRPGNYPQDVRDACVKMFIEKKDMTYKDIGVEVANQFGLEKPIKGWNVTRWAKDARKKAKEREDAKKREEEEAKNKGAGTGAKK